MAQLCRSHLQENLLARTVRSELGRSEWGRESLPPAEEDGPAKEPQFRVTSSKRGSKKGQSKAQRQQCKKDGRVNFNLLFKIIDHMNALGKAEYDKMKQEDNQRNVSPKESLGERQVSQEI